MKRTHLSAAIALACCLSAGMASAQSADGQTAPQKRTSVSSTSNQTTANDTKRAQQMQAVNVTARSLSLGGGLMSVQDAPKAVSTISREAIEKGVPGATFVQAIESIPGGNSATDDITGLNDGSYSIRGYTSDEIGTTVNGAPINDSGNYKVYSTEYGDTENMGDITVLQGYPDMSMPVSGAAGGSIAWVTIDPTHDFGVDFSQSLGSNSYHRTFLRLNTGDTGPVRSWLSYSNNETQFWRGPGQSKVTKIDGKSIWTIDDRNSISASFQYNREFKNSFNSLTKAQAAQNYFQSYQSNPLTSKGVVNTNYYQLHVNPFVSWLASLDGEFTLGENLHLTVVPYFQYGTGGGSSTSSFTESANPANAYKFKSVDQDLNGDGVIGGSVPVYALSYSYTFRTGVIFKFNQNFGLNNSLEYGFWYERPRQQQGQLFTQIYPQLAIPVDNWGTSNVLTYPNGLEQRTYAQYTTTETRKVFVTDTWTPNDQWTYTLGGSYLSVKRNGFIYEAPGSLSQYGSQVSNTFDKFPPAGGVKVPLASRNQVYLGVGETFRAPVNGALNAALIDSQSPQNASAAINKPETSWTGDLGWRFYGDRFSASVDAYASNFKNKQVSGFDQNTGLSIYQALPKVNMHGLDAEASYRIADHWKIYGSYGYTVAKMQSNFNVIGDGIYNTDGKTLINTPRNTVFTSLSYGNGPFWASFNAKYRSSIWGDWSNTEKAGGFTTFNLNAGWNFPDMASWLRKPYIKVNVSNIFDHRAFTFANNSGAYLASNPTGIRDVNGNKLYASTPYYSLLQDRTFMVTFGASFF